jgi:hypothetical protein
LERMELGRVAAVASVARIVVLLVGRSDSYGSTKAGAPFLFASQGRLPLQFCA